MHRVPSQVLQSKASIPIWIRSIVTSLGLAVSTIRTFQEWYPPFDENARLRDVPRLNYIYSILYSMGVPLKVASKLNIVVGERNGLKGGPNRFVGLSWLCMPIFRLICELA